jgi:hypothetical protein
MPITLDGTTGLTSPAGTFSNSLQVGGISTSLYPLVSGTAVASTSGTSIDFTGIPSWVKRITVMFQGVSTNGSSIIQIQLGTSSGVTTSGYLGSTAFVGSSTGGARSTTGLLVAPVDAATVSHGSAIISAVGSNSWVHQATIGRSTSDFACLSGGSVALSGVLDRVRITTVNGTDAFDAGTINILYE